jgi:hypothetical protein
MWALLERVADLERRVGSLYERFAALFRARPLIAAFWNEMAGEERLHAVLVAATREVFPVTAPAPPGEWAVQLTAIEQRLAAVEVRAAAGVTLYDAFASADEIERSELNAVTELIIRHAGRGFSRLAPFIEQSGVDHHRDKLLEARHRYRIEGSSQSS